MKQGLHTYYYESGELELEIWFKDDKWHKIDGPAFRSYRKNGKIDSEDWYVDGKWMNEEEVAKMKIMIELNKEVLCLQK